MRPREIHYCLDCEYIGHLVVIDGTSQCPSCASRAVWPVSGWIKAASRIPFTLRQHLAPSGAKNTTGQPYCSDMIPSFCGGLCGHQ